MNNGNTDLATMLDELNLPLAAERLTEILSSPELGNYSPQQLLREVIEPQYIESMNRRYITNLRLSRLINKNAQMEDPENPPDCTDCGNSGSSCCPYSGKEDGY